jgi:hypothetical protein
MTKEQRSTSDPSALDVFAAIYGRAAAENKVAIADHWHATTMRCRKLENALINQRADARVQLEHAVAAAVLRERAARPPFRAFLRACDDQLRKRVAAFYSWRGRWVLPESDAAWVELLRTWRGRGRLRRLIGRIFSRKEASVLTKMLTTDERDFGKFCAAIRREPEVWKKYLGE